ncbi:hypothetical protein Pogu_1459 [Pyrobaculum oguniense TE7]|uniref:Uncharacterized protein n=1 Tax=Pyrobaculum oguniense (strain DSM 13380 / JCM 10595 / TE7) TaxID=698757 RepID=H6QAK6_PYROT|nr:hypothetical protein Pogu_1459 [Pyrobaculum oguniense TE7]
MVAWVEVLERVYPALASRYGAVVGCRFYIFLGLAPTSKDIVIFIEDFSPLLVSRVLAEAL